MKVAFVLAVALLFVALASAGGGKKYKESKENRKGKESWESKKSYKGKDGERVKREEKKWQNQENEQRTNKKRSKRDETLEQDPIKQEGETKTKYRKEEVKGKRKDKMAQEDQIVDESQTTQPIKKKVKKVETTIKKEEQPKKSKKQEQPKIKEPVVEEEEQVIIEPVVEEEETVEAGECQQEAVAEECTEEEPQVTLSTGAKIKGKQGKTVSGKETAEFQGVPYAEPPEGKNRLREAVLKENWPGVLDATQPGSDCLQYSHFTYNVYGSEDCLYLNIYTPRLPKAEDAGSDLLPVVVYFHGGAFMFFSGAKAGAKYLLEEDVVFVSVNYRLGPLGFFTLGDDTVPGNLGLRDQMTALKWVKNNINSFGGDPTRVTISGMSAGGASVHYHMLSPLSKGLFSKAISISGTALNPWAEAEELIEKSHQVASKLGCSSSSSHEIVDCLRTRSAERIVATAKDLQVWLYNPISPWAPSPESKTSQNPFLPDSPINLIMKGEVNHVPWLVSFTNQEGGYPGAEFVFDSTLMKYLDENWNMLLPHLLEYNFTAPPERKDEISQTIKRFYLKGKLASVQQSLQPVIDMQSDRLFLEGISEAVKGHRKSSDFPIYLYRFSHLGDDSVSKIVSHGNNVLDGACHADDVGYIIQAMSPKISTPEDLAISRDMVSLWYSFVTTGIPKFRGETLPSMDKTQDSIPFLDIGKNGQTTQMSSSDLGNQKFWTTLGLSDLLNRSSSTSPAKDEL